MTIRRVRFLAVGLLAVGLAVAAGCGESDQEEAFREASEQLEESREAIAEARKRVEAGEAEVGEAEARLAEAREELAGARQRFADAQAAVGRHATDDVLFREVQGRLLEDRKLAELAISARVEKGVVTLTGEAESDAQRQRAGELAEAVAGVIGVDNRIVVATAKRGV